MCFFFGVDRVLCGYDMCVQRGVGRGIWVLGERYVGFVVECSCMLDADVVFLYVDPRKNS